MMHQMTVAEYERRTGNKVGVGQRAFRLAIQPGPIDWNSPMAMVEAKRVTVWGRITGVDGRVCHFQDDEHGEYHAVDADQLFVDLDFPVRDPRAEFEKAYRAYIGTSGEELFTRRDSDGHYYKHSPGMNMEVLYQMVQALKGDK